MPEERSDGADSQGGAPGGVPAQGVTPSTLESLAHDWAMKTYADPLASVKEAAKNWFAAVGAVTTLLGTGAIIGGTTAIRNLANPWIPSVVAGLGLAALAAATFLASSAAEVSKAWKAEGINVHDRTNWLITDNPLSQEMHYTQEFNHANDRLCWSRWTAGAGATLMVAFFVLVWVLP